MEGALCPRTQQGMGTSEHFTIQFDSQYTFTITITLQCSDTVIIDIRGVKVCIFF